LIDLYTWSTPNGRKVSIMLEECALPYVAHPIDIGKGDQFKPEFVAIQPNSKIPAIVDSQGPEGQPYPLFESGAILMYLAWKTGRLFPTRITEQFDTIQWLMFQMGGVGPFFGQVGFFHKFAGKEYEDKRPRDRYAAESKRLLAVLDHQLADRPWIVGDDYSIADIATFPWVNNLIGFYGARELVAFDSFPHVERALKAFLARPAVQRGLNIPPRK